MKDFLEALIISANKGAQIARIARKYCASKTAQEKVEGEGNPRFQQDFKTIADVFVQETVRYDLLQRFPKLLNHILGEETNTFDNENGEKVCIEIQNTQEGTAQILEKLLEKDCASELANVAHGSTELPDLSTLPDDLPEIDMSDIGVWIDPIDCTAEFIKGEWGESSGGTYSFDSDKKLTGLPCVTVLIGAFLRSTGEPIVGVINQPFYSRDKTHCVWGVCYNEICCSNLEVTTERTQVALLSAFEGTDLVNKVTETGYRIARPPGAGFKLLMVATGSADAYMLSKDTTFRWDTCAPHAILRSLGGDVITLRPPHLPLRYNQETINDKEDGVMRYANKGGIIAYRSSETLQRIKDALST